MHIISSVMNCGMLVVSHSLLHKTDTGGVNIMPKTTTVSVKAGYITVQLRVRDNLPGTEDTVIK